MGIPVYVFAILFLSLNYTFNVSIEVCGKRLWNSKLKLKLNSRHFFLFITYNGFRISHWFLEHHFIKQHDQIEKDLKKKHLRIKIPSHKNTFTKKKQKKKQKLYHLIIKHFLRIGKHHLHNSHKTDSFLPFWDLYLFWKKRDRKTGQSLQQLFIFHCF